jgi:hypothetical protein
MSETVNETPSETENTEIAGPAAEAAEPAEEVAQEVEEVAAQDVAEEAKPKRRIRGTTLLTAAIVLGVLGGVGTGYAIQYTRPATPLAPLTGSQPAYAPVAVYQGIAPAMLPASQDDATMTGGDLTKLLLPVPSGASTEDSVWVDQLIDPEQDAQLCTGDESSCLTHDFGEGLAAVADTEWSQNGYDVDIRIYRLEPGDSSAARTWASDDSGASTQLTLPSGVNGSGEEFYDANDDNDDNALAVHGDLVVEFWVTSPSTVPNPSIIDGLITQQMGRL